MDNPARLKRTGGFPKKQREKPVETPKKQEKSNTPVIEPKREIIAKSQGALYRSQCPRCTSRRISTCMCYMQDHRCLKCDYRWHICMDLIHMTNITNVETHAGRGCTFCREMHKQIYL